MISERRKNDEEMIMTIQGEEIKRKKKQKEKSNRVGRI